MFLLKEWNKTTKQNKEPTSQFIFIFYHHALDNHYKLERYFILYRSINWLINWLIKMSIAVVRILVDKINSNFVILLFIRLWYYLLILFFNFYFYFACNCTRNIVILENKGVVFFLFFFLCIYVYILFIYRKYFLIFSNALYMRIFNTKVRLLD